MSWIKSLLLIWFSIVGISILAYNIGAHLIDSKYQKINPVNLLEKDSQLLIFLREQLEENPSIEVNKEGNALIIYSSNINSISEVFEFENKLTSKIETIEIRDVKKKTSQ